MYYFHTNLPVGDSSRDTISSATKQFNEVVTGMSAAAVVDESNAATSLTMTTGTLQVFSGVLNPIPTYTDDAAWDDGGGGDLAYTSSTTFSELVSVGGLDAGKTWIVELNPYLSATGRTFVANINGGTEQEFTQAKAATTANTLRFTVSGTASVAINAKTKYNSNVYLKSFRIYEDVPSPAVATTDTLSPGTEFTLTATNFASAPVSPATLTDSQGSTITVPVTISGSGPYTAVGTMPTLAEAVTAGTSLLFGDVTIELST